MNHPVAREFSMDLALDEYTRANTGPRPSDGFWHPSGMFLCERKAIYDIRETPRPDIWTLGDNRALLIGNVLGPVLQAAAMEQVGSTLRYAVAEPRIQIPDFGVVGNADLLIQHADGTWEVVEDKTANSASYGIVGRDGAKPEHIDQAKAYTFGIRYYGYWTPSDDGELVHHEAIPDLERIRLAYWDKNKHGIREFPYKLDEAWEARFMDRIERLDRYREDGTALPPRLAANADDHWLCKSYCDYRQQCYGVDPEGVEL